MKGELLLENGFFLQMLKGTEQEKNNFIPIIDLLKELRYKIVLIEDDNLMDIFQELYIQRNNEDVKIINRLIEKLSCYKDSNEFNRLLSSVKRLETEESNSFKEILYDNMFFDEQINTITYMNDTIMDTNLRNIFDLEDLKIILLLFTKGTKEIVTFTQEIKKILNHMVFDEGIERSIEELNDGFELRRNEIIYHLFYIQKDIPNIVAQGFKDYRNIGNAMSLSCSPERDRNIVKEKLTKIIDGKEVNCELHTKMGKLTTKPPDRIYFCPSIPTGVREGFG